MKKLLLIAISLVTVNAFATKARLTALGNAFNVVDSYGIFTNPLRIHQFNNLVSLETGKTSATSTTDNAEGLFYYTLTEKARIAVALGDNDAMMQTGRRFINAQAGLVAGTTAYVTPQNMLHVFYGLNEGDNVYAGGIFLSSKNDKITATNSKENSAGLSIGMKNGVNAAYITAGLTNTAEQGAIKFDGSGYTKLSLRTTQMDLMWGFDFVSWTAKSTTIASSTENYSYANQNFGLRVAKSIKTEGSEVFYGANINQQTVECKTNASAACTEKFTRTSVPVFIGLEVNAADWLTLRGSVTQSIMDTYKDEAALSASSGISGATGGTSEFGAGPNTTAVAAGVGVKFNKITLDGTITTAAAPQTIDTTSLMSQVGLTYNF